ncbi:MAG: MFS transporter [Lawsonibacter sp.]|nr:MFS transporter [Lawsonibacter sp.]
MTKKKKGLRATLSAAHDALRRKKVVAVVYFTLRFLVIAVMVAQFFNGDFESVFLCGLTLVLFLLPTVFERALMIDLPNTMEIIIMLFIFAAEILGEISSFYTTFRGWDTILHTLNGFLCAAIGFALVDMLNRTDKFSLSLSPVFMSIVAFCFSMTIGVLWEFFECGMDQLMYLDMQKDAVVNSISSVMLDPTGLNNRVLIENIVDTVVVTADGQQISLGLGGYLDIGLLDTMKDLFVNFIGAVVFSAIGYFYVKSRGKGRFASRFIPQVVEVQPEDLSPRQPKIFKKSKKSPPPEE